MTSKPTRFSAMDSPAARPSARPLTITQLAARVRILLEEEMDEVWAEGEISNWKAHPASGHCYFSLKDENAQLSAVMWRSSAQRVAFEPRNGMLVEVRGHISFYEPQGRTQIIVQDMHEAGVGLLWKRFLELKIKLEKEGLFDAERKRPLPALPSRVGVVTSPSGAAFRDILKVLTRRFAGLEIILWPVRVQGEGAAREIAHAVSRMGELGLCDVLIVGRGGGSMEDLWAFNEECVARAIAACPIPVVSAVGHEVDFTISDFVADLRAPTPSAAAERVIGEKVHLLEALETAHKRLGRALAAGLEGRRSRLQTLLRSHGLAQPRARLRQAVQRRDELAERLDRAMRLRLLTLQQFQNRVRENSTRLERTLLRLLQVAATQRRTLLGAQARLRIWLQARREDHQLRRRALESLEQRLLHAVKETHRRARSEISAKLDQLTALNPTRVLQRGYAVVRRARDNRILRNVNDVKINEHIRAQLANGYLRAVVIADQKDFFE